MPAKKKRVRVTASDALTIARAIVAALKVRNVVAKAEGSSGSEPYAIRRAWVRAGNTSLEIKGTPKRQFTPQGRVDVWSYTVFVGDWSRTPRKRFPPRKAGHDYDAIALATIAEMEAEEKRERYRRARLEASAQMENERNAIILDLKLDDLSAWLSVDSGKLHVDGRNLSAYEARAIMWAWKQAREEIKAGRVPETIVTQKL